jgi:PAP2 superfamily
LNQKPIRGAMNHLRRESTMNYRWRFGWLAVAFAALAALGGPAIARGDAVIDWSNYAQTAILTTTPPPTAHASTLSFAMVQGAVYDAVNAIGGKYHRYLVRPAATPFDSKDAAAATAAFQVLKALYPGQLVTLQANYNSSLAAVPDGVAKANGISVGEQAAAAMLQRRANDGRGVPYTFVIGTTPGVWRMSPPLFLKDPSAWVGGVKPFLVPNVKMLRSKGPNRLTSAAYAKDFNEVKEIGSLTSTTRTPDQTMAAIFWQAQPMALYGGVMRLLSARLHLTTAGNARLFAMVSLAAADGAIGCWNDKYYWNFWRPTDAIRQADTDGNAATTADPNWWPLFDPTTATLPGLSTPAFPDHPSGHSCVSSAIMHTMQKFFGTDKLAFDITSPRFPSQPRHFNRFSAVLTEIINARVWGGIHFRTADTQGALLGKKVADWEAKHYFQRVR